MGTLRHMTSGSCLLLRARSWIGRHASADVSLTAPGASIEHATIHWDGLCWSLCDRASRNGTRVNDVNLLPSEHRRLSAADVLVFGDPAERWLLTDVSPPRPFARRLADGGFIQAHGDALFLPGDDIPMLGIYHRDGRWVAEGELGERDVLDGEVVQLDGQHYRLFLPAPDLELARTQALTERPRVADATAQFEVSPDEELVRVTLLHQTVVEVLPEWACNYLLLHLARAVRADLSARLPATEAGWRYADELSRQLASTMTKLNLDVHRARRSVETLARYRDPEAIVQRRRTTGQMRFGTLHVVIDQSVLPRH